MVNNDYHWIIIHQTLSWERIYTTFSRGRIYIYVNFLRYFCFQSKPFFILYLLQTVVNNSFWNVVCRHVRLSEGGVNISGNRMKVPVEFNTTMQSISSGNPDLCITSCLHGGWGRNIRAGKKNNFILKQRRLSVIYYKPLSFLKRAPSAS